MSQFDPTPPDWVAQVGSLVGAGAIGMLLRELIKRLFARADKRDDLAVGLRTSILDRLDKLETSNAEKDRALEEMRRENTDLQVRLSQAEANERWVRNRYHRLMNWMQKEPSLPQPPSYLFEDMPLPSDATQPHTPRQRRQHPPEPMA